ncbi:hypothetical protein MHU86_20766 [Fragilaria crotonensis]|nr:hypothetical protein MHU86_20766 [Fragilaria crotonensis]
MIVDETAYRSLMEYLRTTVKPQNMRVMEVSRRFQGLCMYAKDLPMESGEMPVHLRADEMKSMFYNSYDAGGVERHFHSREFTNDGNASRGNGSNGNNIEELNNNNGRERRDETVSSSCKDNHYMNNIGMPE